MQSKTLSCFGLGALVASFSVPASAAPSVASAAPVTPGSAEIVLAGRGFGSRAKTQPVLWDDFEARAPGAVPGAPWSTYSSGSGKPPLVVAGDAAIGTNSVVADFTSGYNSTAEFKQIGGAKAVYLSYYLKWQKDSGEDSRNVKFARLSAGFDGTYQEPLVGYTEFDNQPASAFYVHLNDNLYENWWSAGRVPKGRWMRVEYFVDLGDPGVANGTVQYYIDGVARLNQTGVKLRDPANPNLLHWLSMPYYVAHDPGGAYRIAYDEVYLDTSRARVEVCDAPTWAECKTKVLQVAQKWSDSSITFSLRRGPIAPDAMVYAYVVDAAGGVNSTGVPIESLVEPKPPVLTVD